MASAGLSWREILASLTTNPAARLGEESRRATTRKRPMERGCHVPLSKHSRRA